MRNLKKILALVLALVMSLSLMATAGAESFKDVTDDNPYKTAIDVLTELKVVKGYGDGNFQPDGQLNRAEAAVLVYRIATGDVEDKYLDNYTFMQQSKFTDLDGYNWAKGYINYCQNAGIVVGTDATHFNPGGKVTGYQLLVMLLRTLGYGKAGEFADPKGWELQTAAIAEREGITANVTTGDFGAPAPRAMVAELLFRGLLTETVTYSALVSGGYTKGETLGMREFKLEEVEGVVVANEFANLYGTSVLANGKTNLEITKDDVRNLDKGTEITDIGESRYAYITGSKVLAFGDTGKNKVTEFGHTTVIDTPARFQAAAEMPAASDIEYFVNFDRVGNNTCDQRLEFSVIFLTANAEADFRRYTGVDVARIAARDNNDGNPDNMWTVDRVTVAAGAATVTGGANLTNALTAAPFSATNPATDYNDVTGYNWPVRYNKIIRAGVDISEDDLAILDGIFGAADNANNNLFREDQIMGDVFVGTKSTNTTATNEERDLSNSISYKQFVADYITTDVYDINWDRSDNGEWVKFVDNDGDGSADYAFLTESNLDEALSTYTKDDATVTEYYSFSDDADNWYTVRYLGDTPVVGDVVLYSLIDGQILVEAAKDVTTKVTDYSWKDDIITTTDGEYGQSGISNWTEMQQLISTMADDTDYVMYLDHFGYVRAYKLPGGTQYALVTEIYYKNNAQGNLVQNWPMMVELATPNADGAVEKKEYNFANSRVNGNINWFVANTPWTQIQNLSSAGNYYNWVQPAIAHLGVERNVTGIGYLGATKGTPVFAGGQSTYWPSNYQVINNIRNANPVGPVASGMTGLNEFNYGEQMYGNTTLNANGSVNWNQEQDDTASFTNVAIVNINGEDATLTGAAQLRLNRDGSIAYTDRDGSGVAGDNLRDVRYAVDYIQLSTDDTVKGQARYAIANNSGDANYVADNNYYVNAVDTTEYYIVYNGDVLYFKGYANMPALTNEKNMIHAAYAVARDTSPDDSNTAYWVADVIVYEVQNYAAANTNSISLAYYTPSRSSGSVQLVNTLSDKGTPSAIVDLVPGRRAWNADLGQWGAEWEGYGFYKLVNPTTPEDGQMSCTNLRLITGNWNSEGIFAGIITRVYRLAGSDYIDINLSGNTNTDGTLATEVSLKLNNNIYSITEQTINQGTANEITRNVATALHYDGREGWVNNSQVKPNDRIIWVGQAPTNGTVGSSSFIVDVGNDDNRAAFDNRDLRDLTPAWLYNGPIATATGLWPTIYGSQTYVAPLGVPFNLVLGANETAKITLSTGDTRTVKGGLAGNAPAGENVTMNVPNGTLGFTMTIVLSNGDGVTPVNLAAVVVGGGWAAGTTQMTKSEDGGSKKTYTVQIGKGTATPFAALAADAFETAKDADVRIYSDAGATALVTWADAITGIGTGANELPYDEAAALETILTDLVTALPAGDLKTNAGNVKTDIEGFVDGVETTLQGELDAKIAAAKAAADAAAVGYTDVAAVAAALSDLKDAIEHCTIDGEDASNIATYWDGTALVADQTLVKALADAVKAAEEAAASDTTSLANLKKAALAAVDALFTVTKGDKTVTVPKPTTAGELKTAYDAMVKAINDCTGVEPSGSAPVVPTVLALSSYVTITPGAEGAAPTVAVKTDVDSGIGSEGKTLDTRIKAAADAIIAGDTLALAKANAEYAVGQLFTAKGFAVPTYNADVTEADVTADGEYSKLVKLIRTCNKLNGDTEATTLSKYWDDTAKALVSSATTALTTAIDKALTVEITDVVKATVTDGDGVTTANGKTSVVMATYLGSKNVTIKTSADGWTGDTSKTIEVTFTVTGGTAALETEAEDINLTPGTDGAYTLTVTAASAAATDVVLVITQTAAAQA